MPAISDCRVLQVVNIKKGIHCMIPKNVKTTGTALRPLVDTARLHVCVGKDADLNKAMDAASMGMIKLLQEKRQLSRLDAYGLASAAMDCRLVDVSAASKAIHCAMPKNLWLASK